MGRTVGIGIQDFEKIRKNNYFYIDKTHFIKEWWESGDDVTLITRPRRFGKTLTVSMLDYFFSVRNAGKKSLFEGLSIWQEEKYRELQGTYPVISLSFANIKETNFVSAKKKICQVLTDVYVQNNFLRDSQVLTDKDRDYFDRISMDMEDSVATLALYQMSDFLYRYYGRKVIILLDEYDTPMQEAYIHGYWEELVNFTRSLFNSAFKTNPALERGIMTGITRVSKESIFSDLNNLEVVTTTSDKYAAAFGFTEEEVFAALEECGLSDKREDVKKWYDGFTFGSVKDIYNPWSIMNFLDKKQLAPFWANSSSNSLIGKLLREGKRIIKQSFEGLLKGEHLITPIDEQIIYDQLDGNASAVWSLLLASGYLKVISYQLAGDVPIGEKPQYELALTNYEVQVMFQSMVSSWFVQAEDDYNDFIRALLRCDVREMNLYMNQVALSVFSYFDTGNSPSVTQPERFYHGFVLGLLVELNGRYVLTSNRESGFGRYDVMLEPLKAEDNAYILEFKVHDDTEEATLQDTVNAALAQIEDKMYEQKLLARGIAPVRIHKYGFAFEGKHVLIG
ncbi:MAG: AAA family ATPase [Lachnospiraceae bacterium]|nr:AAA family ATPase [Lachnospiraceae bacterium]